MSSPMGQKIPIPLTLYNYKSSIDMSSETLILKKKTLDNNKETWNSMSKQTAYSWSQMSVLNLDDERYTHNCHSFLMTMI